MLTDNSLTFKHLGARLIFFTELLVRMLLYILLTTNCITLSSFLTNNLMRALCNVSVESCGSIVFPCSFQIPMSCNTIRLHNTGEVILQILWSQYPTSLKNHIYNNRKYSEITMMLHLNIESILKINCITPETNSLIYCININCRAIL
jgi:hypothetical protein